MRQLAIASIIAGKSKPQVAKEFGVCLQAVHNWWNTYQNKIQNGGAQYGEPDFQKTLRIKRGRKTKITLSDQQQEEIKNIIATYLPRTEINSWGCSDEAKGLAYRIGQGYLLETTNLYYWARWTINSIWSISTVQKVISIRYGVELSLGTVNRMLKNWGFIPEDLRPYPKYFRKQEPIQIKRDIHSYPKKKLLRFKRVPYHVTLFRKPKSDVSSIIAITGKNNVKFVGFKNSALNQPTLYFCNKVKDSLIHSLIFGLQKEDRNIHFYLARDMSEFRTYISNWDIYTFSTISYLK